MVRPTNTTETIMSVQETSEIRELTATELDEVTGGFSKDLFDQAVIGWMGACVIWAVCGLLDWIFD
jgi:hypothetical protein